MSAPARGWASRAPEQLRAALQSIWSHRMRSVLTTLGIIIGVASVITVVNLTKSLEARIMADVNQEGSLTFFLSPGMSNKAWRAGKKIKRQPLDSETIRDLQEMVPQVKLASPDMYIWGRNTAKAGDVTRRVMIHAIGEQGLDLANLKLAMGRPFTATDRSTRAPVVVLGARIAEELGVEQAVGRTFTLNGQTAEVVGILKKQGDMPFVPQDDEASWGPDNEVYVPFGSFKEFMQPWMLENISYRLQIEPSLSPNEAEEVLRSSLRRVRGLHGDDPDNFNLETNQKQVEMIEKLTGSLMLAAGGMVSISLLVGGIGVMNIMLVSVTERTREIGIRKALGARRRIILTQFLIEAMLLCLVGGLIGLGLGLSLGGVLSQLLLKQVSSVPLWAVASAFFVPAVVGLGFGLYPAAKASKLDPIEALRYE
ncbi:MAG: ABC transporter permease [Acidobacteria bacterium]|nr:ABC transporter permease [Acidobacteriota bacterium]MBI3486707.1 ABC transporter permease [Acidobacteriota bacterium]